MGNLVTMDSFAFIIHPIDPKRDVSRKFPLLGKLLNERQISFFSTYFPPVYISEIKGITSAHTGKQIRGHFVACPLTPDRMLSLPEKKAYRKIIQTGRMAERLGVKMLGLGAFTSVVGDAGITVASHLDVPVTSGDAYTVAVAVQALRSAAQLMGIPIRNSTAAVVGATGAIGRICAEILSAEVGKLYLIGRRPEALEGLRQQIVEKSPDLDVFTDTSTHILKEANLIITVTSASNAIIHPEDLQAGSVICDVARPRDVSAQVAQHRKDVLVIDGGMVEVPGKVDFGFDFGLPSGKAYACMAETMALTLEGRFEDYTLGKDITRARVEEITTIAEKHGFRLSGLRSFEKPVSQERINRIRECIGKKDPRRLLWEMPDY
jgi:fatty aldehyde-generating acyl-ACP reductase